MTEDVRFVDLLFEQETNGREEFKKMIHSVFKVSASTCYVASAAKKTSVEMACAPNLFCSYESMLCQMCGLPWRDHGAVQSRRCRCQVDGDMLIMHPCTVCQVEITGIVAMPRGLFAVQCIPLSGPQTA